MIKLLQGLLLSLVTCAALGAPAEARAQSQFDGVARIVVIGDLEGAYDKYLDMLRQAQLIDAEGNWIGGRTHLVQLGDIPDRGPNSRAILDHLMRIERQARRAGGHVHALIGNHEAMNIEGDLRYVHPGEYAAFADANSPRRREAYYRQYVAALRARPPASGLPTFDAAFRAQWDEQFPLGYVEHRLAWAPNGAYGRWVSGHNAIVRINDTVFMHAGLGPAFANADRDAMNRAITSALRGRPVAEFADIVTNQEGPLWYRGLALHDEAQEAANLAAVLARQGAVRVVVGHTKRASAVLPRFNGRVIITDIAVPSGLPDPHAFLIIEGAQLTAVHRGQRVPLTAATPSETCAYLAAIAAIDPPASPVARLARECAAPATAP